MDIHRSQSEFQIRAIPVNFEAEKTHSIHEIKYVNLTKKVIKKNAI